MNYSDVDDVLTTIELKVIDVLTEEQQNYFAKNMNDILTKRGLLDQSASETLSDRIDAIINRSHEPLEVCDYAEAARKSGKTNKVISNNVCNGTLRSIIVNKKKCVFVADLEAFMAGKTGSFKRTRASQSEIDKRNKFVKDYFADNGTATAGDLADLLHDNCDYSSCKDPRDGALSTVRGRINSGLLVNLTKLAGEDRLTREDTVALAGYKPQQQLSLSKLQQDYEDIFTAW
jgi:hypothetical protein